MSARRTFEYTERRTRELYDACHAAAFYDSRCGSGFVYAAYSVVQVKYCKVERGKAFIAAEQAQCFIECAHNCFVIYADF